MKSPPLLILASTSTYRRDLLERTRIPFECVAPGVDETPLPNERARSLVARLALAKARSVAAQRPGAWVIGSDQAALLHGGTPAERILGKPGSLEACSAQLLACSGQSLEFVTAVAVVRCDEAPLCQFIDATRVTFRTLDAVTVGRYLAVEAPLDCAGGFKSEGLGITLCESIYSADPTGLIGLPLIRLCAELRKAGIYAP